MDPAGRNRGRGRAQRCLFVSHPPPSSPLASACPAQTWWTAPLPHGFPHAADFLLVLARLLFVPSRFERTSRHRIVVMNATIIHFVVRVGCSVVRVICVSILMSMSEGSFKPATVDITKPGVIEFRKTEETRNVKVERPSTQVWPYNYGTVLHSHLCMIDERRNASVCRS